MLLVYISFSGKWKPFNRQSKWDFVLYFPNQYCFQFGNGTALLWKKRENKYADFEQFTLIINNRFHVSTFLFIIFIFCQFYNSPSLSKAFSLSLSHISTHCTILSLSLYLPLNIKFSNNFQLWTCASFNDLLFSSFRYFFFSQLVWTGSL